MITNTKRRRKFSFYCKNDCQ